jgi:hypothetical protein
MGLGTGASGMSQGVELGLLEKINFIGRTPLIRMAEKRDFRPFVRILHQLMAQHKAFQQGSEVTFIDRNHDAVIAGLRFHPEDPLQELYLLIANLDIYSAHTLAIAHDSLPTDERTVYDVLHQVEYSLTIFDHPLFLEASAIRIFRITKSIHKSV